MKSVKFPAFDPIDLSNNIPLIELSLTTIMVDPNQPRKTFQESTLEELAESIKKYGIIQPIIVQDLEDGNYKIIAGERRWRAAKLARLETIPAIIRNSELKENKAISLIENIQRESLNPIELAEAFDQLNRDHKLSHEEIAAMVGKSRASITNFIRLLNLSTTVRNILIDGKLEMGHARSLLPLPEEEQIILANKIIENKVTVRETERLVKQYRKPKKKEEIFYSDQVNKWGNEFKNILSSKVSININQKGEGKLTIHFSSPDEVNWIIEQLKRTH